MARENMPPWIIEYWTETPTEYTKDDIHHLEPDSVLAVFLKYWLENGFAPLIFKVNGKVVFEYNGGDAVDADLVLGNLTIQRNGTTIGTYNGSDDKTVNMQLGTLTVQKNGTTVATYNGDNTATANITVPIITYGTSAPSGGSTGDVYMRYLA